MTAATDDLHLPRWAVLLRADNPGPMTLEGTNTWLLREPGESTCVIVDPGPAIDAHLDAITTTAGGAERVTLIVLTHWHHDHSESARALAARTGAPVRAHDPALCVGAPPLADDEKLREAGLTITVKATPGHTKDSLSLHVENDSPAVLTGDTVLGRGTTVVLWPDGHLGSYLRSLDVLGAYGDIPALPGHGPVLPSVARAARHYRAHREQRLAQVTEALAGGARTAMDIVETVYADVDRAVWPAAEATVKAQLEYLDECDREHIDPGKELGEP